MGRRSNRSLKASEDMRRYWKRKKAVQAGTASKAVRSEVRARSRRYKKLIAA
jgi:hypothetical protein